MATGYYDDMNNVFVMIEHHISYYIVQYHSLVIVSVVSLFMTTSEEFTNYFHKRYTNCIYIGIHDAEFVCGKVENNLTPLTTRQDRSIIAIADPPRGGLRKLND